MFPAVTVAMKQMFEVGGPCVFRQTGGDAIIGRLYGTVLAIGAQAHWRGDFEEEGALVAWQGRADVSFVPFWNERFGVPNARGE